MTTLQAVSRGHEHSLGTGPLGLTLFQIERARLGLSGWNVAHDAVRAIVQEPVEAHSDHAGLFRGAPAVAFVLHAARQPSYATALTALDEQIVAITCHRLRAAHERIDSGRLPELREFDLISGLTGLGTYLLSRHGGMDLLSDVLHYLVRLTEPLQVDGVWLPGWWSGHGPSDQPSPKWAGGHGNLGLAHGISGPLALLATAMRRGITVDGQAEAINRICLWLDKWRCSNGRQTWWPGVISQTERQSDVVDQPGPQRPSWCYGTPGLVRAQQLAAIALDDQPRQRQVEEALIGCVGDDAQLSQLTEAGLCHGWAGLIQAVTRIATDAYHDITSCLPRLCGHLEQHADVHTLTDDGLLDGTAGTQLARLTAAHGPPASGWDACLLTAG